MMRGETEECNESMKSRSLKERGDGQTRAPARAAARRPRPGRRWLRPRIRGVAAAPSPATRLGLARICFLRKDGGAADGRRCTTTRGARGARPRLESSAAEHTSLAGLEPATPGPPEAHVRRRVCSRDQSGS